MSPQPLEARCDHCGQQRPLFLYEPDHNCHLVPVDCEWCDRDKQPLLCARCWSAERLREENAPVDPQEVAIGSFFTQISENNARINARRAADKATCDGIAAATQQADEQR